MKRLFLSLTILAVATMVTSCKTTGTSENPLLQEWTTEFGVPPFDKIQAEHYRPAFDTAMSIQLAEIDAIVTNADVPTFENTILALDNSGELLMSVSNVFFLIASADTNEQLQAIEGEVSPLLAAHSDKIMMNDKLFERVKTVYEKMDTAKLDAQQQRLIDKSYRSFVRSGAALDADKKEQLKKINEQLSTLEVQFSNNLLSENNSFILELQESDLTGLNDDVKQAAAATAKEMGKKEGTYVFTLHKPSLIPFITQSDRRDLRQKLYEGYLNRCSYGNETDNSKVINEMIRLKTDKAHLLGFDNFAAYTLDKQMAKNTKNVYELLDALWTPALASSKAELEEMKAIKKTETGDDEFASWDWWYYAEKVRKAKYDLDEEMLRPYLSLDNVTAGIFNLCNRLYGISFRPATLPVFNSEMMAYEVIDKDNSHLGVLYLDFHPRAGKRGGAWCGSFRDQSYVDGKRVAPITSITCNFTRPSGDKPALLNLDETETYFHEFGHALHTLFSDVKYKGLGGVERDFVELPSQIMENWCTEPQMLKSYATHYQTGEPMPDYLIEKVQKSSLFNQGFATVEYLAASLSDMDIHNVNQFVPMDIQAFEKNSLNTKRGLIPQIAPRYRYPYYAHIFNTGYSAGYYSYIWAEVLDKDAYQAFVESGDIFNRDVAAKFRTELLSQGGTQDGMVLYENFRSKAPSREPLLRGRGLIQ